MFSKSQGPLPGMNLSFPDVCLTPTPAGPVPTPYPNIGLNSTAIPNVFNQFIQAMPIHNLMTKEPVSTGGVGPGIASGMVCGPVTHLLGSFKVFASVMPVVTMMHPTMHDGMSPNSIGSALVPSQVRVLVLG